MFPSCKDFKLVLFFSLADSCCALTCNFLESFMGFLASVVTFLGLLWFVIRLLLLVTEWDEALGTEMQSSCQDAISLKEWVTFSPLHLQSAINGCQRRVAVFVISTRCACVTVCVLPLGINNDHLTEGSYNLFLISQLYLVRTEELCQFKTKDGTFWLFRPKLFADDF